MTAAQIAASVIPKASGRDKASTSAFGGLMFASLFLAFPERPALVKPYVQGLTKTPMDSTSPGEHFYETMQIAEH